MKVLFEKKGPLAYVTINRPERLNACDGETYRMLTEVWREFRDDSVLRVGILTGAGERAFCVGTDVKAHDFARLSAEPHNLPFSLLSDLGKPLIAAINGHANGSGLEQALCCDTRVAAEHAQFGLGDARLGWLPAAGGTQRLPRLISLGRALELLYTGNRIGAREAWRLGLVDHVVPMSQLISKCEEIATEICQSAPLAVQNIKRAVRRGLDLPLAEGLKLEQDLYQELQETDDAREGARAFAEKRSPQWRGK
jgi:enoyl-CoA hydratase/carnithine racemase